MNFPQSAVRNLLLRAMSSADYALLEPHLTRTAAPIRMKLHLGGEITSCAYFPEDGVASIVAVGADGKMYEIGIFGYEGMSTTSLVLRTDRSPHEIFMQVPGKSVLSLPTDILLKAIDTSPSLHGLLLRYVQAMMVQIANATTSAASGTVDRRLARWLLMCHDRIDGDVLRLTHEFMAMMLGARRASVTEALHLLEGRGYIGGERGVVRVIDRAGLESAAGDAYGSPEAEYQRLIGFPLRQASVARARRTDVGSGGDAGSGGQSASA